MALKQQVSESLTREEPASQARTAAYIADLVGEMERLARRERLSPLDRLLGVAREEARRMARET